MYESHGGRLSEGTAAKKLGVPYVDLRQHDFHPQTVKLITDTAPTGEAAATGEG